MNNLPLLSYEDFIMQDDEDKYMMLQESEAYIKHYHSIIKEAINYIDDNIYYKNHKGHINIDDLYIILQKGSDKE